MTKSQAPTPELLALHCRYGQSRCTKLRNRLVEAQLNLVRQQAACSKITTFTRLMVLLGLFLLKCLMVELKGVSGKIKIHSNQP